VASAVLVTAALAAALAPNAAGARSYDCRHLGGGGVRSQPWRIPAPNYQRTVVSCPGFPLGQGAPDFYVFRVPSRIDDNDSVTIRSRPTASEPAEVSLALDDLGPFALNIRGERFLRGPYAYRRIVLANVDQLTIGLWYIRAERLRAVASAPAYRLTIDLR
jgi:hypothetical protein